MHHHLPLVIVITLLEVTSSFSQSVFCLNQTQVLSPRNCSSAVHSTRYICGTIATALLFYGFFNLIKWFRPSGTASNTDDDSNPLWSRPTRRSSGLIGGILSPVDWLCLLLLLVMILIALYVHCNRYQLWKPKMRRSEMERRQLIRFARMGEEIELFKVGGIK